MKIVSWNVNGLRACHKKGFLDWLNASGAEVVGVQEVRSKREQLPGDFDDLNGWHLHVSHAERAGYSGVGLFSRRPPDELITCLDVPEFDCEGRLQIARFGALRVANVYFPNGSGQNRDNSRIPYKLDFYRRLFEVLEDGRASGEPILVMGDFNTAHKEIDLARPKANVSTSGFCPEEREELDRWLRSGWTDTLRHFDDRPGLYTWWGQRFGVREKNIGWRIDMVLASPGAMPYLRGAFVHPEVKGSDHCPVGVEVDPAICAAGSGRSAA